MSGKVRGMQETKKKEKVDQLTLQVSEPSTLNPRPGKKGNGGQLTLVVAERPIRAALYEQCTAVTKISNHILVIHHILCTSHLCFVSVELTSCHKKSQSECFFFFMGVLRTRRRGRASASSELFGASPRVLHAPTVSSHLPDLSFWTAFFSIRQVVSL